MKASSSRPDQTTIAFSDYGLGADDLSASQIFMMDLTRVIAASSRRTLRRPSGSFPRSHSTFIDNRTIIFEVNPGSGDVSYSVRTDGSDLHPLVASLVAVAGANVVPRFDISRGGTHVADVVFPGEPLDPVVLSPGHFREIFVFDGGKALQLTLLHQFDTHLPVLGHDDAMYDKADRSASMSDESVGSSPSVSSRPPPSSSLARFVGGQN